MSTERTQQTKCSSRRDFLKTSTAAIGAATVGGLAIQRSAHAAGDDTIKFGLIGCGGRGSGAAGNAMNGHPKNILVAMADVFEDKTRGSRDRLKKVKPEQVKVADDHCFSGLDGYKKVIASDVDVVLIACASVYHPIYMKAAIEAGKHVFVEKPHGTDGPGIRMTEAACKEAEKKGLSAVSGLCWRYHPGVQETMKRVLDGAIGDVVAVRESYMRPPYRIIKRDPSWSEMEWQFRNWYHFNWLSGDDILQSLVHSLDKANWAMREETPVAAFALGGRSSSFEPVHGDQFDHQGVAWEYADGRELFGFSRAQAGCYNETSDHIMGTKGRADVIKHRIEGETTWRYKGPKGNMYDLEQKALFDSVRAGKPINDGRYMASSTMLGIIGRMAAYTGQKITWEQAMNSKQSLLPENVSMDMDPPVKLGPDGLYPVPVPGVTKFV